MAEQPKVDSNAIKPNADLNTEDSKPKETSNMRSILAEIGISTGDQEDQSSRPKFRYSKEQLLSLSKTPSASRRPPFLDPGFFNDAGYWDPEKWAQNDRSDGSYQRTDEPKAKREKPADLDKDVVMGKKRTADPKERLKEEQDGIILSPQRRSFGTGCHVIQQQAAGRRSESPTDGRGNERDAHRESSRRIGSGRFIPRDRDRDREREFGYRGNDRRDRDHYDRDDRDAPRDGRMMRERSGKDRDMERRGGRGFRRIEEEEEPEWFSGGPTSQNETIELRGFDDAPDDGRNHEKAERGDGNKRERRRSWRKQKTPTVEDIVERNEEEKEVREAKPPSRPSSATDHGKGKDKGGGEGNRKKDGKGREDSSTGATSDFDFEDLFKMDSIPGIFSIPNAVVQESGHGLSGSRFGQFFQHREPSPIQNVSSDTSRRSSFQDELIAHASNQNANMAIPSPSDCSDAYFTPINPAQPTQSNNNNVKSLFEIINGSNDNDSVRFAKNNSKNAHLKELAMSGKATSVQELEAGLKNLVMGGQGGGGGGSNSGRGVTYSSNSNGQNNDSLNAFNKLLNQISDGQVTPLSSQGMSCTAIAKNKVSVPQDKDVYKQQSGGYLSHQQQGASHLMNILKHAPTEQDILAGLVKGQPLAGGSQGQASNDVLGLLAASSAQSSRPTQTSTSRNANLQNNHLSKMLNLQQNSGNYGYGSGEKVGAGMHGGQMGRPQQQQQHMLVQSQAQAAAPPTNRIQQQQREILAAILKQQQQQQQQVGRPPSPVQVQHAVIQRSSSPSGIQQSVMINGPGSPRSQSPRRSDALQQAILQQQQQQQQQQHARIPSPLVFGQTPPVITHAPSPIHPGQMAQSIAPAANSMNPNTLQVHGPHVMTRVPSPQELRAHTQQIMQNALIKKKLEEQKENYRKRQEMQGARSPNPVKFSEVSPTKPNTGMSPTLIPTSVMRKMQVGKDKDVVKGLQLQLPSSQQQQMLQPQPMGGVMHADGGVEKLLQSDMHRQLHGQTFVNGQVPVRAPQVSVAPNMPSQLPLQGRRIIKSNQGIGNQAQRVNPQQQQQLMGNQSKAFPSTPGNVDIVKQLMMQQQQQQQAIAAQRQLNVSPMSSVALGHSGMPIRGANPMHSASAVRSGVNMASNNYLLRNMVHPAQPTSLTQLNQLAVLQQRGVDPRQMPVPTHLHPMTMQQLLMGVQGTSRGNMPLSAGGHAGGNHQQASSLMGKSDPMFSISSSSGYPSMNSNFNNLLKNVGGVGVATGNGTSMSSGGRLSPMGNLDKWFGKDLKQKMPNLPPVPTQRAQYVEEVEQRQQTTTVQN